MEFESRVFTLAKDADRPGENQDACRLDADRGIAAIADGASSGLFSRLWASLLTDAVLHNLPDPEDKPALAAWLAELRQAWSSQINTAQLAWFQRPKLREGAFSTLLWILLSPFDENPSGDGDDWHLCGFAIGDSCLFHVRSGEVLRKFPIQNAAQLQENPVVIGSVDLNRDGLLAFHRIDVPCRTGDLLVLCTDAVADWALRQEEAGCVPAWEDYWNLPEEAWCEEIQALRAQREMRCDDTTLMLLRVGCVPSEEAGRDESADGDEAGDRRRTDSQSVQEYADGLPIRPTPEVPSTPPPLPETFPAGAEQPPPLPPTESNQAWVERVRTLSGRIADQVAEQVGRGVERLKGITSRAQSALRKYRDRLRGNDPPQPPGAHPPQERP